MAKSRRALGIGPYGEKDWQAEADLDTLMRADEIKKDAKRFKRAQACARHRLEAVAAVTATQAS